MSVFVCLSYQKGGEGCVVTFLLGLFHLKLHVEQDVDGPLQLVRHIRHWKLIAVQPLGKLAQVVKLLPLIGWELVGKGATTVVMQSVIQTSTRIDRVQVDVNEQLAYNLYLV